MEQIREILKYFMSRKKFWLLPIFMALFLIAALIVFTQGSALAPFIYTIF